MAAMGITALDQDAISNLLGSVKQRGEYDRQLKSFVEGDEAGIQVSLTEGPFTGKKPNSVKTGFETAKSREGAPAGAANVRVLVHEDNVYLVKQGETAAAEA
jgi:hypothetical protein